MQKKPYAGKYEPFLHALHLVFITTVFTEKELTACCSFSGANMMAIIVKVAAGKRPCLEPISNDWPGECQQMVDLMKRCWDQDPKQRPSFTGVVADCDPAKGHLHGLTSRG